ncbi:MULTISPECIES: DUF3016 domain-containing protein [Cupriavidus]|uniref:DUF3016 domain-containing protein n=1 Tax=Cupriavidus pauculus TaxID=82633 RepID=A0A3G8H5Y1_9BURK|nr:DUF3016 domain-containing protein [Cupriavidus pauculus]AZG15963.1 DUF3016 domain-containing protein [Cupriavidus pauculus]
MSRFPLRLPWRFSIRLAGAPLVAMLATMGGALAAEPPSALTVTFLHPDTYQDASRHAGYGSDAQVLQAIRQHLQKLAARGLPPGYALSIEVLDIDLAGYVDWRYPSGLRIVRDATWPRMTLRYVLTHGDETLATREERIHNMHFNWGVNLYGPSDPLRYEKAMLDDWFERAIARRVQG